MNPLLYTDDITDITIEELDGNFFIHMEVKEWGVKEYKNLLSTSLDIQEYLKSEGIDTVYMIGHSSNHKLIRFAQMFGFKKLIEYNNFTLMYLEMM